MSGFGQPIDPVRDTCLFCGEPYTEWRGPGPVECSWWARLHFKLLRSWPRSVVEERLFYADASLADLNLHTRRRHGGTRV